MEGKKISQSVNQIFFHILMEHYSTIFHIDKIIKVVFDLFYNMLIQNLFLEKNIFLFKWKSYIGVYNIIIIKDFVGLV